MSSKMLEKSVFTTNLHEIGSKTQGKYRIDGVLISDILSFHPIPDLTLGSRCKEWLFGNFKALIIRIL